MRFETGGALPVHPGFDVLRAGFVAAQAATPTARANADAHLPHDAVEAIVALFGDAAAALPVALRGSFRPALFEGTERKRQE